ncbi:uncharacterized protein PAC_08386 [Phialocephala subalpina]|uniref:Uncharacterized protein n=1 Tax=Phialocephala subalpina TaxID=576137 RepID=A0A1L7X0E9_9HELO|nr:uncharacterized protein PAC_08386 [Phialocephala subalpina]
MDLHRFRVEQRSFSPSPANSTNPDITISAISGSQTSNSPTGPTFHFQPNPLIPQRGVLQSIPWGQEPSSVQSSIASPLQSPAHLLPGQYEMQMPVHGAVGGGRDPQQEDYPV